MLRSVWRKLFNATSKTILRQLSPHGNCREPAAPPQPRRVVRDRRTKRSKKQKPKQRSKSDSRERRDVQPTTDSLSVAQQKQEAKQPKKERYVRRPLLSHTTISMCQLLGLNAAQPTDFSFSLRGFVCRGGSTDVHSHGWGICIYEGRGLRCFHDTLPACQSPLADLLQNYPIRTYVRCLAWRFVWFLFDRRVEVSFDLSP